MIALKLRDQLSLQQTDRRTGKHGLIDSSVYFNSKMSPTMRGKLLAILNMPSAKIQIS